MSTLALRCPRRPVRPHDTATARWFFALLLTLVPCLTAEMAGADPASLILVLDASSSMADAFEAAPGDESSEAGSAAVFDALGESLDEVAADLPDDLRLGLVAYGHRYADDCRDVETVLPLSDLDRAAFGAAVAGIEPRGTSPVARALEHVVAQLKLDGRPATVVLATGAGDACDGDPCAVVRTARDAGLIFQLQVVGLRLDAAASSAYQCAAEAAGGHFFPVDDAAELSNALRAAAAGRPEIPPQGLRVKATADGALADVTVHITDPEGNARGVARTLSDAATNPRFLPLKPGSYRAVVSALAIEGRPREQFDFVVIEEEILDYHVDFSAAELSIEVRHNGALGEGVLRVRNANGKQIAAGRTTSREKSNPKRFRLAPGDYAVEISSSAIDGKPTITTTVTPSLDGPTAFVHDFASGGLEVKVTRGDKLFDALVTVRPRGGGQEIVKRRARKTPGQNPVRFDLEPGAYSLEVREVSGERSVRRLEVEVRAGEVTSTAEDFPALAVEDGGSS